MTFSIVARCQQTGQLGVGAATAMVGVGKLVAHAQANVGAAASQAMMNPYLAFDGLRGLDRGADAPATLRQLVEADPGREGRQFGLVDAHGRSASHTGSLPEDWKGHLTGDGYAAQGNRLAGPDVLNAAVDAYLSDPQRPLVERLLEALKAGEAAGGDTKGHRSAGITVVDTEEYPLWDLRIDTAASPLEELYANYIEFSEDLLPQVKMLPTRDNPLGGFDYGHSSGI